MRQLQTSTISESKDLIRSMADLALLVGTRSATHVFPPPAGICKIILADSPIKAQGSPLVKGPILSNFDFSGVGAFSFYRAFQSQSWKYWGSVTDDIAKQVVYHSTFGTFKEDFGILGKITNCLTWKTRKEMAGCFKASPNDTKVTFDPVKQILYSKSS